MTVPRGTVMTQRLRPCRCARCGYRIYVTRKWLRTGLPTCPCGAGIRPDDPGDAAG